MTKSELVAELAAAYPHLRREDVAVLVTTIFGGIADALARGERVELRGFGIFMTRHREARTARHPRTGEAVSVNQKSAAFFKAGRKLRTRINRGTSVGKAAAKRVPT